MRVVLSSVVVLPLGISNTWHVKPISGTTVDRWRTESPDWRKIIDVHSRTKQMIRDMEHHDFANKQRVGSEWL
jgi:hypothetical protein